MLSLEAIGFISGVLCVWLYTKQNILCWPIGLLQVSVFAVIFFEEKLYSDFLLHIIYILLQVYGWQKWRHFKANKSHKVVQNITRFNFLLLFGLTFTLAYAWGLLVSNYTDAAMPFLDAYIAVTSLIAQFLITRKYVESWIFWIIVNITAIYVYFSKALFISSALYVIFLLLAIHGFFAWRKDVVNNVCS